MNNIFEGLTYRCIIFRQKEFLLKWILHYFETIIHKLMIHNMSKSQKMYLYSMLYVDQLRENK